MKKLVVLLLTAAFSGITMLHAGAARSYTLAPESASVEAGKPISIKANFVCEDGYMLVGWNASIIRKNAPKEFFAKPGLKIQPHATAHGYDTVHFSDDGYGKGYIHFAAAMKDGNFPVVVPTAGLSAGDYMILIMGRFMKDGKSYYVPACFYLTITKGAAADVPFKPSLQCQPFGLIKKIPVAPAFKSFEMTPAQAEVKKGDKVKYTVKFTLADPKAKAIFATIKTLRKEAAPGFFDQPGLKISPYAKDHGYDAHTFLSRLYPAADGTVTFELDTKNFVYGTYLLRFELYAKNGAGSSYYPTQMFGLSVQ